ncbi:MAG: tripartite tricarboxylate transporter substrate binding protein BugD, partial [Candidatus Tectomicrobia bacterium]
MLMRQFPGLFLGALLILGVGVSPALADSYPSKPITLIIPMGAGGSHDLNARVFTSVMPEFLGQAIVVKL